MRLVKCIELFSIRVNSSWANWERFARSSTDNFWMTWTLYGCHLIFFRIRTTELWVTPNISDAQRVLEWGFSLKWSSTFLKFSSFRLVRAWLPLLGVIKLPVVINFLCQLLMVLAGGASLLFIEFYFRLGQLESSQKTKANGRSITACLPVILTQYKSAQR